MMPMINYLRSLNDDVPADHVVVHNHVRPTHKLGMRGFRAWHQRPDEHVEICDCGWAADKLAKHYRVKRGRGEP